MLYAQDGSQGERRVLIDPNTMRADGPVALTALAIDDAGTLAAYGISKSGSDRQEISVRDVETGADISDRLLWVKFASIAWVKDGSGFYYTRFPEPGTVAPGDENYFNTVCYHRLGDVQSLDRLIFEKPTERETVFGVEVSDDDRWVVITAFEGSSDRSEVYVIDRQAPSSTPVPLVTGFNAAYAFIESAGEQLLFRTDKDAPRGRIVSLDPLIRITRLWSSSPVRRRTVVSRRDSSDDCRVVSPQRQRCAATVYALRGASRRNQSALDWFADRRQRPSGGQRDVFGVHLVRPRASQLSLQFHHRTTLVVWRSWRASERGSVRTTQVWYPSQDGTRVSMFLVSRKGLPKDSNRPVLLTGYGGFNISLTPAFDPSNFVLFEGRHSRGARISAAAASTARRGIAGMFERKQNVFDDFIAAAEWLAASGYPRRGSPSRAAATAVCSSAPS